jgi:hypothetical protein
MKLSDPEVRSTIGRDLFHQPAGGQQTSLASARVRRPNAVIKEKSWELGKPDV